MLISLESSFSCWEFHHLLQPVVMATFVPMKRRWHKVLSEWKDDCVHDELYYATIPERVYNTFNTGTSTT